MNFDDLKLNHLWLYVSGKSTQFLEKVEKGKD